MHRCTTLNRTLLSALRRRTVNGILGVNHYHRLNTHYNFKKAKAQAGNKFSREPIKEKKQMAIELVAPFTDESSAEKESGVLEVIAPFPHESSAEKDAKVENGANIGSNASERQLQASFEMFNKGVRMVKKGMEWYVSRSAIYFSLDIEYWERNSKLLTEIGFAVYDPSEMVQGTERIGFPIIKASHFVVKENKGCRNGQFVSDNKFNFSFGQSIVMPISHCRTAFETVIKHYEQKADRLGMDLVLVGHDVSGDIRILKKHEFYVGGESVERFDTLTAWKATPNVNYGALTRILKQLKIPHGLLHNAGNDAYLTLQLALNLCDPAFRQLKRLDIGDFADESHSTKRLSGRNRRSVEQSFIELESLKEALAHIHADG